MEMQNDNLKFETVASTNFPAQAELIRTILESGGIKAYVINSNAPTYVGLVDSVLVLVESSQADTARKFLEENLDSQAEEDDPMINEQQPTSNPQ